MKISLLAHGTRGDIQPMLAIAGELIRRGHQVTMTANTNLAPWAEKTGVPIVSTEPDLQKLLKSDRGKALLASGRILHFTDVLNRYENEHMDAIIDKTLEATHGADLILSSAITAYRAMSVAEARDIPHGTLWTMPLVQTNEFASFVSPIRDFRWGPLNRLSHDLGHAAIFRQFRPGVEKMRARLGLPTLKRRPLAENLPTAQLYSQALLPRPRDWAPGHELVGFPQFPRALRERVGEGELPDTLARWLDDGPPPVFFGFGSMPIVDPEKVLAWVVELSNELNIRALVGAGWAQYRSISSPTVFVTSDFDHDTVLPRCVAAVHHGGAGTTAAVARAGLPAFVISVFADQPFWGWRIQKLGAGTTLPIQRLSKNRLRRGLEQALDPRTKERAQDLGRKLWAEDGASNAADLVDRWAQGLTLSQASPKRADRLAG